MENTNLQVMDGRTAGKACKRAASKCNFSVLVYLLVTAVAGLIISFGLSFADAFFPGLIETIRTTPLYLNIYIWGTQILVMYVIGYPVFHVLTKDLERRDTSVKEKLKLFDLLKLAVAAEGVMLIGSLVAGYVTDLINAKLGIVIEDTTSEIIGQSNIWVIILVVVIIGPIFEELIFRKTFIDTIGKYNIRLAIFISGVSFALFHGNITQAIYTLAGGLILAWVYAKTKNFFYPVFLHMFMNFFGSIPSLIASPSFDRLMAMTDEEIAMSTDPQVLQDIMIINGYTIITYGFLGIGGLLILSMVLGGYFKLKKDEGEVKIPFFKKLGTLIFNWGTLAFVIYSLVTIILDIFTPVIEKILENMAA